MKRLVILFIITIFVIHTFVSHAQDNPSRLDISAGLSIPEAFNLGGRWQYNNNGRLHFKLGSNFNFNDIYYSATVNHCWCFGKLNTLTNKRMWGFNTGYTLSFVNSSHREGYSSFLNFYFSREFKLAGKFFIEPELGVSIPAFNNTFIKDDHYEGYNLPVILKFGINMIYCF